MSDNAPKNCAVVLEASGLDNRSSDAVAEERGKLRVYAHYLAGSSARGRSGAIPAIAYDALKSALKEDDADDVAEAAFIAGRCMGGTAKRDEKLNKQLKKIVARKKVTVATVEASMALVLRGHREAGLAGLKRGLVGKAKALPWLAAAYLAQTGDGSGWTVITKAAANADAEIRVEALNAALVFRGLTNAPDVAGLIAGAAGDDDSEVRESVPRLLKLVAHPEARELTKKLAAGDPDEAVRSTASDELEAAD